jgi:hypothetical protein
LPNDDQTESAATFGFARTCSPASFQGPIDVSINPRSHDGRCFLIPMLISADFQFVTRRFLGCSQRRLKYELFVLDGGDNTLEFCFKNECERVKLFKLTIIRACAFLDFLKPPHVRLGVGDASFSGISDVDGELLVDCLKKRKFFK